MSAEAVLALWVIVVGSVVVAPLAIASAVLQRHADRANAADDAAVEADLGKDMAELAGERHLPWLAVTRSFRPTRTALDVLRPNNNDEDDRR